MEQLLREIKNGIFEYQKYEGGYSCKHGKGSKAYVTKRIDLLREQLLEMKKGL